MKTGELVQADQALFGYADGHRQIAASVRLSSKDLFQLAAATDLATGARLAPDESYLSGLPLSESRRYALIKTWPAPEMPRPGCVWSHVILLDPRLLSSYANLSDFLSVFRRPSKEDQANYDEPLLITNESESRLEPDRRALRQLIRQYYTGEQVVLRGDSVPARRDAAIFAMWSQQWPRLRTSFSFRTVAADTRRRCRATVILTPLRH